MFIASGPGRLRFAIYDPKAAPRRPSEPARAGQTTEGLVKRQIRGLTAVRAIPEAYDDRAMYARTTAGGSGFYVEIPVSPPGEPGSVSDRTV